MNISGSLTAAACISYPWLRDPQFATDTLASHPAFPRAPAERRRPMPLREALHELARATGLLSEDLNAAKRSDRE